MDHSRSPLVRGPKVMPAAAGSLVADTGSLRGQRFLLPLAPSSLTLGRDPGCSLPFPSEADADRLMGRRHAQIDVRADGAYLIDLNSANGTVVAYPDGRMEAVASSIRLRSGMRIGLGGEEGTWLSVQLVEDVEVAVHQPYATPDAGQRRDAETIRMPKVPSVAPPQSAVHRPPSAVPAWTDPAVASQPAPVAPSIGSLEMGLDPLPSKADWLHAREGSLPTSQPDRKLPERRSDEAPMAPDHELHRHRVLLLQQVAIIAAVLLGGCVLGLVLGIRPPAT